MKMSDFMALSDAGKMAAMPDSVPIGQVTEDKGICHFCGGEANADDFCFGCHQLVCLNCMGNTKHKCV